MSELFYSIDPWAAAWNFRLWNASWQGALAIALAWGIARWCTFLSPRVICWVWRLACLKLLVSLVWLAPVLIPLLPAPAMVADAAPDATIAPSPWTAHLEVPHVGQRMEVQPARPQRILSLGGMIALAWVTGVACSIVLSARQWQVASRLRSSAGAAEQRITGLLRAEARLVRTRRLPQLLASSQINSPILVGVIWPAILLPTGAGQAFSEEELRLMLAHELAHFKRRDLAWNWLPTVVGWLFFFHPLVWLMKRSWSEAQEAACDEMVLESHRDNTSQYGRLLLKLATAWPGEQQNSLAAAGVLGAYRNLERRFLAIARVRPRSFVQLTVAAAVLTIISLPGLIPWRLVAQESVGKPAQVAIREPKSQQPKNEVKRSEAPITGTTVTGTFQPDAQPAGDPKPPSEAHVKAAADIEKLGGMVYPFNKDGSMVYLSERWKGGDSDIDRLLDVDDLKIVVVENCTRLSRNAISALRKLKPLARLQLMQPTDDHLAALKDWDEITDLSLFGNLVTNAGLESVGTLSNLKSFQIGGESQTGQGQPSKITDAGLVPLAKCKHLKRFTVIGCPQVTGRTIGEFAGLRNLDEVSLFQISLADEGLAAVARLPHLKRLNLMTKAITSAGYAPLYELTELDQFSLFEATQFDDAAAAILAAFSRLRVLQIHGGTLTDSGLAHVAPLRALHALEISKGAFSDAGLAHIKQLDRLRRLRLSGDLTITDDGLKNLSGMTHLKQLALSGKSITDEGLESLTSLPNLESLSLAGSGVLGSGLDDLAGLQKLRFLDLSNSPIGDDELARLAKLPALEELNLSNTAVTDKGLAALSRAPRLSKLQLVGDKITDAGLDALSALKTLRSLRVDSLALTKEARKRLEEKLPDLDLNSVAWTLSAMPVGIDAKFLELGNNFVPLP